MNSFEKELTLKVSYHIEHDDYPWPGQLSTYPVIDECWVDGVAVDGGKLPAEVLDVIFNSPSSLD